MKPSKETLDFPSPAISSQRSAVLRGFLFPVPFVRRNQFDAPLVKQPLVERVAVISFVAYQPKGLLSDKPLIQSCFHQSHFMRRSTFNAYGDWKTSAVHNCHDFGALAAFGRPNAKPPFLAAVNEPSMKVSVKSSPPLSLRSVARDSRMRSSNLLFTHSWYRRWQVSDGGYRSGKSLQGAPVRNIHRIASKTSRLLRRGRPLRPGPLSPSGIKGSMIAHCLSVNSIGNLLREVFP